MRTSLNCHKSLTPLQYFHLIAIALFILVGGSHSFSIKRTGPFPTLKSSFTTYTRPETKDPKNLVRMSSNQPIVNTEWTTTKEADAALARDELKIWPLDEYNAKLLNEVHPMEWPGSPSNEVEEYDLVVIGAGAGGLVSSRQVRTNNKINQFRTFCLQEGSGFLLKFHIS